LPILRKDNVYQRVFSSPNILIEPVEVTRLITFNTLSTCISCDKRIRQTLVQTFCY